MIRLTLPYPPGNNHLYRRVQNRTIMSAEGREYRRDAGMAALLAMGGQPPIEGPVAVTMEFYRPRRQGDLDNRLKACLDSMNGIVYVDDKQICRIVADRYEDPANPRVEITVIGRNLAR